MSLPAINMCMSPKLFLWRPLPGECCQVFLCLEFLEKVITFSLPPERGCFAEKDALRFELGERSLQNLFLTALTKAAT
jgi:hypothetical protein